MNFSLASLPAEILGQILSNEEHSYLAVVLWKTGVPALREKLASSLTYLELRMEQSQEQPGHLPRMLTSLRALRVLRLYAFAHNAVKSPKEWKSIITSLPKTLQKLHIQSADAYDAVLNLAPTGSSGPAYISTKYKRGLSRFLDLGTLFPHLRTLKLEGYREHFDRDVWDSATTDRLLDELHDLAGLPDSITSLRLPDILLGELKFAPRMPPSLRVLDTTVYLDYRDLSAGQISKDWDLPHLERITELQWIKTSPAGGLSWLPRSVRHCSFPNLMNFGISLEAARTLPPSIDTLYLQSLQSSSFAQCTGSWVAELPKRLHRLSISTRIHSKISDFPRSLHTLWLNEFPMEDVEALSAELESTRSISNAPSVWPPSLTCLHITLPGSASHITSLLPKTLLDLLIRLPEDSDAQLDGESLPPRLTTLSISYTRGLAFTSPLPSSLLHLYAHTESDLLNPERKRAPIESLAMLPASLEELVVSFNWPLLKKKRTDCENDAEHFEIDSSLAIALPPNLTSLHTDEFHCDWLAALPRGLRNITIHSLHGTLDLPAEKAPTLFASLPPAIDSLDINGRVHCLEANFPMRNVAIGRFPSAALRSLPQSLNSLRMPLSSYDASDDPFSASSQVTCIFSLPEAAHD